MSCDGDVTIARCGDSRHRQGQGSEAELSRARVERSLAVQSAHSCTVMSKKATAVKPCATWIYKRSLSLVSVRVTTHVRRLLRQEEQPAGEAEELRNSHACPY